MYRKPAPDWVPSPSSTPGLASTRPASRPLPTSPQPPSQAYHPQHAGQQQQPYLGSQRASPQPQPMTDDEAFELGYPDRQPSVSPRPAVHAAGGGGHGLQALYGAAGHGVSVNQSTGHGAGGGAAGQYGALPQSAYDDANPFHDPVQGLGYGAGGGYDPSPQARLVPQHQQQPHLAPPSSVGSAFSPPPQPYHPSRSPYQLPPHRTLSPIANPGLSAFDATLAAFNGGAPPPSSSVSHVSSAFSSAVSSAPPPQQQQQPYTYHPSRAVDPEQYAGYDRYTAKNLYGENQPGRLRSRSPTPPLEDDLGDGARSPSLEEHFARQSHVASGEFRHLLAPAEDSADAEKAAFLEDLANGDVGVPTLAAADDDDDDDDEVAPTQHFGPAPEGRVLRRNKTRRKIKLTAQGNLVVQAPIPSGLGALLAQFKGDEERSHTTYTAVTCGPDEFAAKGYTLRQNKSDRKTELFLVITMYSEDEVLFLRTLYGVMKNISALCARQNSSWGRDGWKKVVVCIVADGRKHIHPKVLDVLAALGVYQDGLMKNTGPNNLPVQAHLFEYTTSFALTPDYAYDFGAKGKTAIVPCQILFCLKEQNAKKVNSHRWFFNAFAPLLQPNVCVLLDVGTIPGPKSIYQLWKVFDRSSNVGGACGEIAAYKSRGWNKLLNPLVAAQNFEYKMSNILDKPTESVFGYIAVLPGAFSAYRYRALANGPDGKGPLEAYFRAELQEDGNIFTRNMYLAEDRILCFELVCAQEPWVLRYVKGAVGETDVPEDFTEFILQRRRWLNGSLFSSVYAVWNCRKLWRSKHGFWRRLCLLFLTFFNMINIIFSWFGIANFYIFFVILTTSVEDSSFSLKGVNVFNMICQYIYVGLLLTCLLLSLGNRPRGAKRWYRGAIYGFGALQVWLLVCSILVLIKASQQFGERTFTQMIVSVAATFGCWVVASCLALDPWHLVTSSLGYLLLSPMYVNVLSIFAYANLHDLSWGTKNDDGAPSNDLGSVQGTAKGEVEIFLPTAQADLDKPYNKALASLRESKHPPAAVKSAPKPKGPRGKQEQMDYYANFRTNVLLAWALSNGLLAVAILSGGSASTFSSSGSKQSGYMLFILIFVAGMAGIRFLASSLFLLITLFTGN